MDDPLLPFDQFDGLGLAFQGADAAAQADVLVEAGNLGLFPFGVGGRKHGDGVYRAGPGAAAAADAGFVVNRGDVGGGDDDFRVAVLADAGQGVAAAFAAVADKGDVLADVVGAEDQAFFPGSGDVVQHFFPADLAGQFVADQVVGGSAESGAFLQRGVAFLDAQVQLLMAAGADADGEGVVPLHDCLDVFVVENFHFFFVGDGFQVRQGPLNADFFPVGVVGGQKVLAAQHVLVEEAGKFFAVHVLAGPHHRKLENADDHR